MKVYQVIRSVSVRSGASVTLALKTFATEQAARDFAKECDNDFRVAVLAELFLPNPATRQLEAIGSNVANMFHGLGIAVEHGIASYEVAGTLTIVEPKIVLPH